MTDQNTRPTPSSDVEELIRKLRARCSYGDQRMRGPHDPLCNEAANVLEALSRLSPPAQVEVTDEMTEFDAWRLVGYFREKLRQSEAEREVWKDRAIATRAALTAPEAKPVVPAEPVAFGNPVVLKQLPHLGEITTNLHSEPYGDFVPLYAAYAALYPPLASEGKTDA